MPGLKTYTHYDEDGKFTYSVAMLESMAEYQLAHVVAGGGLLEGKGNPDTEYVLDGVRTPRPVNPASLNGQTLENLPASYVVVIDDTEYPGTSPKCELGFTNPGTYTVTVKAFPYVDATYEVSV
jgi:hypothetical protein